MYISFLGKNTLQFVFTPLTHAKCIIQQELRFSPRVKYRQKPRVKIDRDTVLLHKACQAN